MNSIDIKVVEKLKEMIAFAKEHLKYAGAAEYFAQWKASSLNLLQRVFGEDSSHYKSFFEFTKQKGWFKPTRYDSWDELCAGAFRNGLGVLYAAVDDYEGGYLFDTRQLIRAEIFSDFIEQAEHLLETGYFQAAAVIVGVTLEDTLTKLCAKHPSIELPDKPRLDRMNNDLAKYGLYNKLVQKQVTAWADLRNKAAHGDWEGFTANDVRLMIQGVHQFMVTHLL